jgi:hypothetical protein
MKYTGWQTIQTFQSKQILSELIDAKENGLAKMIISDTGIGKTYSINLFKKTKQDHTYVITVGDSFSLLVLLQEIMIALGMKIYIGRNSKHRCLRDIIIRLKEICEAGGKPIIILDEAENSKLPMLKSYKQLYDHVNEICSLVLIGTDQLFTAINRRNTMTSVPQLRRRFKAGTRLISPINKSRDFRPFFDMYIKDAPDVQDLLLALADNYGELHDYLDPVLRYCAKKNEPISENIFRLVHKLPKQLAAPNIKRA